MHLIPKTIKAKYFIGKIKGADILIMIISTIIAVLFCFSNFFGSHKIPSIIVGVVSFLIGGSLVLRLDGVSLYEYVGIVFKYILLPSTYHKNQLKRITKVEKIENDTVFYKGGGCSRILEIEGLQFFSLASSIRESLMKGVSESVRYLDDKTTIQIVKIDRPIRTDVFSKDVAEIIRKIGESKKFTKREKISRLTILKEEYAMLKSIDRNLNIDAPKFYYIIRSISEKDCKLYADRVIKTYKNHGMNANLQNGKECAIVLSYVFNGAVDEKKISMCKINTAEALITPKSVKFNRKTIRINNKNYYTANVTEFPLSVTDGWLNKMFNLKGMIIMNINCTDTRKVKKQIDSYYAELNAAKGGKLSENLSRAEEKQALKKTQGNLTSEREIMLNCSVQYIYSAKDDFDAAEKVRDIKNLEISVHDGKYRQESLYKARAGLMLNKYTNNLTSDLVGLMFPFTTTVMMQRGGVFIGTSAGLPVIIDFNARNAGKQNSNIGIWGGSGSGKSYLFKLLLTAFAAHGEKVFLIDFTPEFDVLAKNMGGQVVDMGAGTWRMNPFQIISVSKLCLSNHLTFLRTFLKVVLNELKSIEFEHLNQLVEKMYNEFSITDSSNFNKLKPCDYPIFSDLYALVEKEIAKLNAETIKKSQDENRLMQYNNILIYLKKFVDNGAYSKIWNGSSVIDNSSNFIVFDGSKLHETSNTLVLRAQVLLIGAYVKNEMNKNYEIMKANDNYDIIQDRFAPITFGIDEAHLIMNPDALEGVDLTRAVGKQARKSAARLMLSSQTIEDFDAGQDFSYKTSTILQEAQYMCMFKHSEKSYMSLKKMFTSIAFSKQEEDSIIDSPTGHMLFSQSSSKRNSVNVTATKSLQKHFQNNNIYKDKI